MSADRVVATTSGEIATRDYGGAGTTILYLHGSGMNVGSWDAVAAAVGDGFRQVAMDFPAHGLSYDIDEWRWPDINEAVDAVIASYDFGHPVVVGHSLGGIVAIRWAAARGADAGPSLIIDVDGWIGPPMPDMQAPAMKEMQERQLSLMDMLSVPIETFLTIQRGGSEQQGVRWDAAEPMVARQIVVDENGMARLRKKAAQYRAVTDALAYGKVDLRADITRVACPLHFIAASSLGLPPGLPMPAGHEKSILAARRELLAWLPTVTPRVTSEWLDCGHNIPIIVPEELAAIVVRHSGKLAPDGDSN